MGLGPCIGDVVRSFVKVPGSGSEKSAKPTIHDLGRVSNLASTIFVPQSLPPTTKVLSQFHSSTKVCKGRKRPRNEEIQDSAPKAKVIHGDAHCKHNLKFPLKNPTDMTKATNMKAIPVKLMAVRIPNAEVQKLKEENAQLRKENEELRRQLSLFKQLIRNPLRLNSVLRRLEERAEEKN